MADGGHEPSMEDILSSIKRIIAEDSDSALSGSRAKRSVTSARADRSAVDRNAPDVDDDVLELTDPVAVEPQQAPASSMAAAPVRPAAQDARPTQPPVAPVAVTPAAERLAEQTIVSRSTVDASRSSLAALSALVVKPEPTGSDTLEGLVREMLRPMIAQWLDARLPEIVERQVAQEVRRISERG